MSTKKLKKKIPNEEKIDFVKKNTIFFKKIEKTENIPSLPRFSSKKSKETENLPSLPRSQKKTENRKFTEILQKIKPRSR